MSESKSVLKEKILPLIEEENLELVELEFVGKPPRQVLRIFVDKIGGVDIEECAQLSRKLSDFLDTEDLIEQSYILEVSTPGLERPLLNLDDFRRKTGEKVRIYLKIPSEGRKEIQGEIVRVEEEEVELKQEDKIEKIPWGNIEKGKIIII